MPDSISDQKEKLSMHFRIVEKGKVYSLQGNYTEALRHYREGLRMCAEEKSPEVFFRHYSQCVMEALEMLEAYDEVISYCDRTLDLLEGRYDQADILKRTYAFTLERKAIQYLLKEEKEEAVEMFQKVQSIMGKRTMKLTDELLNWAQRGYMITKDQIRGVQKKNNYFSVRKENVNEAIAVELPKSVMPL